MTAHGQISGETRKEHGDRVDIIYRPRISCETAAENAIKWLASENVPYPEAGTRSSVVRCTLRFIPFWKAEVTVTGSLEGYRIPPDGSEYPPRIPMHEEYGSARTWNGIAGRAGEIGVEHVYLADLIASPPETCEGPAEPVTVSRESAIIQATAAIGNNILNHTAIPEITRKNITIEPDRITLFAYPFLVVTCRYSGREYSITIDGLTGDIASGSAPGDRYVRIMSFIKGTALLMGWIALGLAGSAFLITHVSFDPRHFFELSLMIPWYLVPLWLIWKSWEIICREYAICRFGPRFPDMKYHAGAFLTVPEAAKTRGTANFFGIIIGYTLLLTGSVPLVMLGMGPWPLYAYAALLLSLLFWPQALIGIAILYLTGSAVYDFSGEAGVS